MARVSSMEPEGILKACTRYVRITIASNTAIIIDSAYSRMMLFFLKTGCSGVATACDGSLLSSMDSIPLLNKCLINLENGQERLLGKFHVSHILHALLALFLLLQQFALTGDVTAVTLGQDVLTHGLDRFAGNNLVADGRLDGNFEHLP